MSEMERIRRGPERIYKETRAVGYATWNPRGSTKPLLSEVSAWLDENREWWPVTARQTGYGVVSRENEFAKDEATMQSIYNVLLRGRRALQIPFEAFRDDGIVAHLSGHGHLDADVYLQELRESADDYAPDLDVDQPRQVYLAFEAAGMAPQLRRATARLPVRLRSGGGAQSVTFHHDLAADIVTDGRPAVVLYVGDLDEWGGVIEDRTASELAAFLEAAERAARRVARGELDRGGVIAWDPDMFGPAIGHGGAPDVLFQAIAVTPDQVAQHDLPEDPKKAQQYQAEALPPAVLAQVVRDAIEDVVDMDAIRAREAEAADERERLDALLKQLPKSLPPKAAA